MKLIVTGATGMVGSEFVRQAILDSDIESVNCIVRNPTGFTNPKVRTLIHRDFLDFSNFSDLFKKSDACVWCLGTSQMQVSKEEYEAITYGYTMAAAREMLKSNPAMKFVFVSGMGADSAERSKTLFARVKGKTENALIKSGFRNLYIVRPGMIKAVGEYRRAPMAYKLFLPLFPLMKLFYPSVTITSAELGRAMLNILKHGAEKQVLENRDLRARIPR